MISDRARQEAVFAKDGLYIGARTSERDRIALRFGVSDYDSHWRCHMSIKPIKFRQIDYELAVRQRVRGEASRVAKTRADPDRTAPSPSERDTCFRVPTCQRCMLLPRCCPVMLVTTGGDPGGPWLLNYSKNLAPGGIQNSDQPLHQIMQNPFPTGNQRDQLCQGPVHNDHLHQKSRCP
jgi:hypothetical protein